MIPQPLHEEPDPRDPQVILDQLPARERATFLAEYHSAVDAAHNPAGYQGLRRLLTRWHLIAGALSTPGYHQALEEARAAATPGLTLDQVGAIRSAG